MSYVVEFSDRARRQFKKLDRSVAAMILSWIKKNLAGCENPRNIGKPLRENRREQWRYRIGDYRILARIDDGKLLVLVLEVGHRREVYRTK